jgi:hypothetical protein
MKEAADMLVPKMYEERNTRGKGQFNYLWILLVL